MIYSVNGTVDLIEPNLAVIDCGGVGYACRTTANTLSQLKIGEKAKLLTYLSVREDAVELFGFYDAAELNCFRMLISVSGVGPKAALSILSGIKAGRSRRCKGQCCADSRRPVKYLCRGSIGTYGTRLFKRRGNLRTQRT